LLQRNWLVAGKRTRSLAGRQKVIAPFFACDRLLAPLTSRPRDVPRCGALSLL